MYRFLSFLSFGFLMPLPALAENHAFFENKVRPILVKHCYECHSEKAGKRKGDLLLDRPSGWLEGGQSGPAVIPGDIEGSLLSLAISHEDPDMAMPEEKLPQGAINVLDRWIQMGAPGPRKVLEESEFSRLGDQDYLMEKARTHWSFQPVRKPQLPAAREGDSGNVVDRFVLRRLRADGLELSPEADRRSLLRRLSYDLTGLPPSLEEIEAFIQDEDEAAYEKQVDRLLASPRFGERWGRYWLDLARYADTREWQAAGRDSRYPFAYTYRDYVIRAFNDDMPYDQFLREQLAADFYTDRDDDPSLAALGFLAVGSRFRGDQDEIANDRIDVVTRGIMGLTVSCARCHDHKYDPIPTSDYYALHGVFRSVADVDNYPVIETGVDIDPTMLKDYERKRTAALEARTAYGNKLAEEAREEFAKRPVDYLEAIYDLSIARTATVQRLISGKKYSETVLTPIGQRIGRVPIEKHYLNKPFWRPMALLVNKPAKAFSGAYQAFLKEEKSATETGGRIDPVLWQVLNEKPYPKNGKELMARYGKVFEQALAKAGQPPYRGIFAYLEDESGECHITPEAAVNATRISGAGRRKIAEFENRVRYLDAEHPAAPPRAMVVEEASLWNARIYNRGDRANRGDPVDRRFLTALGGEKFAADSSGRRELAESIASPDNAFTTRSAVDRIWRNLLGKSLVPSPDDLGLQADPPSHPELLDYLADRFVAEGWSTKNMIRRIVLSDTYRQQSGTVNQKALSVDPENRLYWRRDIRRLDFEGMRDSILLAAGNLDLELGGRAVEITAAPYANRRTVYAYIDRVNLDNVFATFDFPSPTQSNPERPQTMVPQQALYGMNDAFVIEQARGLARQLGSINEGKVRQERISHLYRQIFQREPDPAELKMASDFIDGAREGMAESDHSGWQYGYGMPDPAIPAEKRFTPFPFYGKDRDSYRFSKAFPHPKMKYLDLSGTGGHTGREVAHAPTRRWVAPYGGTFRIQSEVQHRNENGDGVRARIISSREGLLMEAFVFNETREMNIDKVVLEKGDILDFSVDLNENPNSDAFRHTITIDRTGAPMFGEPGYGQSDMITTWDSQADFAGPPPPPLNGWEQLAHALFMTNEFLFVN